MESGTVNTFSRLIWQLWICKLGGGAELLKLIYVSEIKILV